VSIICGWTHEVEQYTAALAIMAGTFFVSIQQEKNDLPKPSSNDSHWNRPKGHS
jgi:hypothetical protein